MAVLFKILDIPPVDGYNNSIRKSGDTIKNVDGPHAPSSAPEREPTAERLLRRIGKASPEYSVKSRTLRVR